jgi:hypothetical protein
LTTTPYVTEDPTVAEEDVLAQQIPASDEITENLTSTAGDSGRDEVKGLTDTDGDAGTCQQAAQAQRR